MERREERGVQQPHHIALPNPDAGIDGTDGQGVEVQGSDAAEGPLPIALAKFGHLGQHIVAKFVRLFQQLPQTQVEGGLRGVIVTLTATGSAERRDNRRAAGGKARKAHGKKTPHEETKEMKKKVFHSR